MASDVALGSFVGADFSRLHVYRDRHVCNAPVGERSTAGELDDILDVARAHYARVVDADIHEELVELHVLLRERLEQVVELETGDRQDRLTVELGVIEPIEEVNAAGSGGGDADAQPTGPFGVGASVERRRFLMPNLNEPDSILVGAQRLNHAVDAVTRKAENRIDAPIDQRLNKSNRCGTRGHSAYACVGNDVWLMDPARESSSHYAVSRNRYPMISLLF